MKKEHPEHGKSFNHLIDEILKRGVLYPQGFDLKNGISELRKEGDDTLEEMTKAIAIILIENGVVNYTGHHQLKYHITSKGKAILESGGWIKYLEREVIREKKEFEKLDWDFKYSKWAYEYKWWPIGISIFAVVLSVIAIFYNPKQEKTAHHRRCLSKSVSCQLDTHKIEHPNLVPYDKDILSSDTSQKEISKQLNEQNHDTNSTITE